FLGGEVVGRPAGELEFGVADAVAGTRAVSVLGEDAAVGAHEDGAEGLVAGFQGLAGEVQAPTQVGALVFGHGRSLPRRWAHGRTATEVRLASLRRVRTPSAPGGGEGARSALARRR